MALGLMNYFKDFIDGRAEEICIKMSNCNKEYINLLEQTEEQVHIIMEKFNKENQELLLKYEYLVNLELVMVRDEVYKQGVFDGIKIAGMIDNCKNNGANMK